MKKTLAILIATSMLIVGFQNSAYAYDEVVDANQFDQDFKSGLPFYPRNVQNESGSTVVKYFYEENLHRISVAYSCDSGANWSQKTIPLGNWGQPQPLVGVSRDGQTILVAWGWGTSNLGPAASPRAAALVAVTRRSSRLAIRPQPSGVC